MLAMLRYVRLSFLLNRVSHSISLSLCVTVSPSLSPSLPLSFSLSSSSFLPPFFPLPHFPSFLSLPLPLSPLSPPLPLSLPLPLLLLLIPPPSFLRSLWGCLTPCLLFVFRVELDIYLMIAEGKEKGEKGREGLPLREGDKEPLCFFNNTSRGFFCCPGPWQT